MRCLVAAAVLVFSLTSWADAVRPELQPASKDGSFHRAVAQRLCFAGRFRFERSLQDRNVYVARCIEQISSSAGHPNTLHLEEVTVALLGNGLFVPEIGRTYCLIVTAGSKRGMTVEAFGPDNAATLQEMKAVMSSPSAFQNDATWQKRRALWAKFRTDLGPDEAPLLYCEDDAHRTILYVKRTEDPFPIHLYRAATGKSEPITPSKVIRGANRITFEEGQFQVWFNGSIELTIDAAGEN